MGSFVHLLFDPGLSEKLTTHLVPGYRPVPNIPAARDPQVIDSETVREFRWLVIEVFRANIGTQADACRLGGTRRELAAVFPSTIGTGPRLAGGSPKGQAAVPAPEFA